MITIAYVLTETKANSLIEQKNTHYSSLHLHLIMMIIVPKLSMPLLYLLKQNTSLGMSGNSYDAKNLTMTL